MGSKSKKSGVVGAAAKSAGAVLGLMGRGITGALSGGLSAVGRCTGRVGRGFKLRMKFFSMEQRLDDLFAVLGRKSYRSFDEDEDFIDGADANGVVRKIGECKRDIKEIEDEVG